MNDYIQNPDASLEGQTIQPTVYLPHMAKGALINLFGAGARMLLLYGYTFFLARALESNELGEYFLMFTIVNLVGLASTVGLDMGVVRYVALYAGAGERDLTRKTLVAGLILGVPIGIVAALVLIGIAPLLSRALFDNSHDAITGLRIFALSVPFWVAAKIFNATTQGYHKMQYQVYSRDIGEQFSKFILSIAALALGLGFVGVIWANVASLVIATIISMAFVMIIFSGPSLTRIGQLASTAKTVYRYSLPLAFSNILGMVLFWADLLLLGYLGTSEDVGYYGTAFRVGVAFSATIILAFSTMFQPIISDLYNQRKHAELKALFKTVTRWLFFCSFPLFLIMVLFSDQIMNLFGSEFIVASGALVLLAFGQLINASTSSSGMMIVMSGRQQLELINFSVALAFNITLCFLLIPVYGFSGAAIANVSSYLSINLLRNIEVWMIMRIHAYDISAIKPFFAGIVSAGIVVLLRLIGIGTSNIGQALMVVIFIAIYLVLIMVMGLGDQDKIVLSLVRNRMSRAGTK